MSEQTGKSWAEALAESMVQCGEDCIGIGSPSGIVGTTVKVVEGADPKGVREKWVQYIAMAIEADAPKEPPGIPCGRCQTPVEREFVLPNWVWNAVVRRGQCESGQEYLCEACFRRAVVVYVGAAQATIQVLSDALAATKAGPTIDGDVS